MCLCEGKGSVPLENGSVIQWHNCPDSNCSYDKGLAEMKWQQFKQEMHDWKKRAAKECGLNVS